jgi:broad specificity phosphatase PhoE
VIYLVRHGQTEFNRERRIQGHVDSPLTELGVRQARAVGGLLADLIRERRGWRIVSSPLGRAHATARLIAERLDGLPIELDDRLKEMSWGANDGRLRAELEAAHPETFGRTGWAFDAATGETYEDVSARVGDWLAGLPPEPERRIIAVSHGISGRVLRGLYAGLDRDTAGQQDVPQDAVYLLQHGGVGRIDCEPLDEV